MNPMVSVIIPVYNTEKYIEKSIRSVIDQSYTDFEIIAINDGSKDKSLDILKMMALDEPRLVVIDKSNTGVSDTRNLGIEKSNGRYITFLDSDDLWSRDYLETLVNTAEEKDADIVACGYYVMDKNDKPRSVGIDYSIYDIERKNGASSFAALLKAGIGISSCMKLYRREMLLEHGIRFDINASFDEDMFFSWKCVLVSNSMVVVPKELYKYRLTGSSAIMRYHANLLGMTKSQMVNLIAFANSHGVYTQSLENELSYQMSKKLGMMLAMVVRSRKNKSEKLRDIQEIIDDPLMQKGLQERIENGERKLGFFINGKPMSILIRADIDEVTRKIKRLIK